MGTKDIVIIAVCFALAGFSLYRKYAAKNKIVGGSKKGGSQTSMPAGKDDDYEPYSGK